ncbi:MAG TPA: transglutaminaseTgpA domain-containing protein [Acidimicrobiia bacterium]|jgi:transglutaminase-like putative cysteine protease
MTALGPKALGRLACSAALAAVAGLEFHRVFGWSAVVVGVVAAAVFATAIPLVLQWRHTRPVPVTVVVSVIAALVFLSVAAFSAPPTPATLHDVVDGFVNGWSRILTLSLPAPDRGDLLVLPFVLTWIAALGGAEITMRSRHALLAVLPASVAYVVALFFGVGTVGSHVLSSSIFAGLAIVAVRLAEPVADRSSAVGDRTPRRVRVPTLVFLVVVVLLAALVGPHLPGASASYPYDPRDDRRPENNALTVTSPLALLPSWAPDDNVLFEVRAETPARWRLAALDEYDGSEWSATTEFAAGGEQLAKDPTVQTPSGRELEQAITIRELRGSLLPAAPQATSVTGADTLFDPGTGDLGKVRGVHTGDQYQVASTLPAIDCTTATALPVPADQITPPRTDATAPYLDGIAELSRQITAGATSPCERATRIADYLSTHGQLQPEAQPGSFLSVIHAFLHPRDGQLIAGTSEQFATAFALLAREAGLSSRVAVGFHSGKESSKSKGVWDVRGTDAFAWPEVGFEAIGWIAFDPSPTIEGAPVPADVAQQQAEQEQASAGSSGTSGAPQVVEKQPHASRDSGSSLSRWWPIVAIVAVVVVLAIALLVFARLGRRRRQRRRRDGDVRERIVGAWRESLDVLTERSLTADRSRTASQWVDAGHAVLNGATESELAPLSRLVNQALFSPIDPDGSDADRAWDHAETISAAAHAGMSRGERLRRLFDPRPFFVR